MRTKFIVLLSLLLVFMLTAAPAFAEDNNPDDVELNRPSDVADGPYTMTQTAHVLYLEDSAEGRLLVVMFDPFTSLQKGDYAAEIQKIPYSAPGAEVVDAGGKALNTVLTPGQEAKITFTYQMRRFVNHSGRTMEILSCDKIRLVGKTLKLGEHAEMEKNKFIGTVLRTNDKNKWFTLYVEGTYVYYGDNEHIAYGNTRFLINSKTKLFDKKGKAIPLSSLKPYQRVEVVEDPEIQLDFADLSPPRYEGGIAKEIRMLEYGDKWSTNGDNTRSIRVVVEQQLKYEGSVIALAVQPFYDRDRYFIPKAELHNPGQGVDFSSYARGTVLNVTYLAVNKIAATPTFKYITKIERESRKLTDRELSGVFGNAGDVSLKVNSKSVVPGAKTIDVTWTNKTDTPLMFGNSYWLEVKKNGKWSRYTKKGYEEGAFTDEGMIINARSERKFSYGVHVWTDKLESGTYRIVTSFIPDSSDPAPNFGYIIESDEFTVK